MLVALAIGVAGVTWAGCGDDDGGGAGSVQQGIDEGVEEAQKGIEKGKQRAQKGIEKGKEEAERGIEEGEKYEGRYAQ
ncbi:MAG: hypothetical protein FVQ78_10100 [Solirubrobacterales bacterium]|nr:hypothetical protein [Solirubrobacterales bacterium]